MRSIIVTLAFIMFMGGTSFAGTQPSKSVAVKVNHEKSIARTGMRVKFVEMVEDSRCPKDVECIWAGNAKIKVRVSKNGRSKIIELNTGIENKDAQFAGYEFKLTGLTPEPRSNIRINRSGYVATIEVRSV